jgi:hypothetical protein
VAAVKRPKENEICWCSEMGEYLCPIHSDNPTPPDAAPTVAEALFPPITHAKPQQPEGSAGDVAADAFEKSERGQQLREYIEGSAPREPQWDWDEVLRVSKKNEAIRALAAAYEKLAAEFERVTDEAHDRELWCDRLHGPLAKENAELIELNENMAAERHKQRKEEAKLQAENVELRDKVPFQDVLIENLCGANDKLQAELREAKARYDADIDESVYRLKVERDEALTAAKAAENTAANLRISGEELVRIHSETEQREYRLRKALERAKAHIQDGLIMEDSLVIAEIERLERGED